MISALGFAALVWGSLLLVLVVFGYLAATLAGVDIVDALADLGDALGVSR